MDSTDQREENINVSETQFNDRVDAPQFVERNSVFYNMDHIHRGRCLIFSYDKFQPHLGLEERSCAKYDSQICEAAFQKLGYEVDPHLNLKLNDLRRSLFEVSQEDHSDSDSIAIVFMSHGKFDEPKNKQFLAAYDQDFLPSELWKNFTTNNCKTLAGKPKLIFIQACRGTMTDKGVRLVKPKLTRGMRVETDSLSSALPFDECVIPTPADILVMWASYPGYYAFKSKNRGIHGSVFIHFLAQVLEEFGSEEELCHLLLTVTRKVALDYESFAPQSDILNQNKQIPFVESTLMRKLVFKPKNKNKM